MSKTRFNVALAGNPNAGKTAVFNHLTGARQRVTNYPGVTVEKKEGFFTHRDYKIKLVDLPGTYSLTAYSLEEIVARNFILNDRPQVVVNIVDATNLERNLYLTIQLLELNIPVVIGLNMFDLAKARGIKIDVTKLSELLGVPVVPTVAITGEGLLGLLSETILVAQEMTAAHSARIDYGEELEEEIAKLQQAIEQDQTLCSKYNPRWLAVKLLEKDTALTRQINKDSLTAARILEQAAISHKHLQRIFGDDPETIIVEKRYGFVEGAYYETVQVTPQERADISEHIDRFLTHRTFSLPIFVALMWLVYQAAFVLTEAPTEWLELGLTGLGNLIGQFLPAGFWRSLVVDGILGGVGNVLSLLPPILFLFLVIAVLEDSGYLARVAFITDRIMHRIGLHGRSVIPMIMGFGCGVPAIMSTRTLTSRRDRLATILIIPFMSCSARLPVYAVLIGAFFSSGAAGNVLFSLYILGIVIAMLTAKLIQRVLLPGLSDPFVMELPPYRMPTIRGLVVHMWERSKHYLKRAGTLILYASVCIWLLTQFPKLPPDQMRADDPVAAQELRYSMAGKIGQVLEPALRPLGLGNWKVGVALISGFAAKEVVISTLATLYSVGQGDEEAIPLRKSIRKDPLFTPLSAYALMVFVLLYLPCMATIAAMRQETGGWAWPSFAMVYTTAIAWLTAFLVYQGGLLLGLG